MDTFESLDDIVPVRNISYGPPRRSLTSKSIIQGLRANLVPVVTRTCQAVAIRCVFDATDEREARKQLAARRRQLEMKALSHSEVLIFYSFLFRVKNPSFFKKRLPKTVFSKRISFNEPL